MKASLTLLLCALSILGLGQTYTQIESAEYDPSQDRWLVSNGSSIIAQDIMGDLSFFGNGPASHGMEVMNGQLFAIYNNQIRAYQLSDGAQVMSVSIPGAGFLNGMGSDPNTNRLWISDFSNNDIIEMDVSDLDNPSFQTVVSNTGSTPNGVVYDPIDDRVVFVSWGSNAAIKAMSLTDYSVTTLENTGLTNIDGIDIDQFGSFFISSWSPTRITRYDHEFVDAEIISAPGLSNPADISYGIEIDVLGIANSGNETLTLVEFESVGLPESSQAFDFQVFPNPVSSNSMIRFELEEDAYLQLRILDAQGREVERLMDGRQIRGEHRVLLHGIELADGIYHAELRTEAGVVMHPIMVSH